MSSDLSYYIDDYSDEILPCEPTLDGWAEWLSKPDADWQRFAPAQHGTTFKASVLRFEDDIVAERGPEGWTFSREPIGADFLAVRFAQYLGWSADNIIYGDDMAAALRDWFDDPENTDASGDLEYVAIGFNDRDVVITYHATPAPRCTAEVPQ